MYKEITARSLKEIPEKILRDVFDKLDCSLGILDAIFIDSTFKKVLGISNLPMKAPVLLELLKTLSFSNYIQKIQELGEAFIFVYNPANCQVELYIKVESVSKAVIPEEISAQVSDVIGKSVEWAGYINETGEHIIDLRFPAVGPHFTSNLLIGNRIGFPHALQTTPKSVVDRFGSGSFRSHAATQVLAGRWDLRQEENGFPANRQFYILENGKQIFYSMNVNEENIESALCRHSQNHTVISYKTRCGLEISRTIFILPQQEGLPIATEVQRIEIRNGGSCKRKLRIVYTGMFGSAAPDTVFEDVLFSNIVMQSKLLKNEDGSIAAIGPDYIRKTLREDLRFHSMILHYDGKSEFPKEFCSDYNEFVGGGTLHYPQGRIKLSNHLYRKGPGFFALAGEVDIRPGEDCIADNFTGIVSMKTNPDFDEHTFASEIYKLNSKYADPAATLGALDEVIAFNARYRKYIQLETQDKEFDAYFNHNLPFQVFYQTFVSRSFDQTQKGYREIGFREIQDLYASMYYFVGMGRGELVKNLLKEWCEKVFEFGYTYHNFFWTGKEAGKWSDDGLWLIQAVNRYVSLTGDAALLEQEFTIAGTDEKKTRPLWDTLKAIIRYSGEISVGKHGLPLLDFADWNDCLKLDNDFMDGPAKEKNFYERNDSGCRESGLSESVMNGFLLKVAVDDMAELAGLKGDYTYGRHLRKMSADLYDRLQEFAWKNDFFARVLFNRPLKNGITYLGAKGDGLSSDNTSEGAYFLNSFSWSILSGCASDEQMKTMLDVIDRHLKLPYGVRLMSPANLGLVSPSTAAGDYFAGDRENAGVFKHACMMASAAVFRGAKKTDDTELAKRLSHLGYWLIDAIVPYATMKSPYVTCGNPRFCTQYNNSETGENVGPTLSGTSTWLTLTLLSAFGVEYCADGIKLDPILRENQQEAKIHIHMEKAAYHISVKKPEGFYRSLDTAFICRIDGQEHQGTTLPLFDDRKEHRVDIIFIGK